MKFNELYSLIKENEEDDPQDWTEWLEDNESDIELETFQQLVHKFNLSVIHIIKNKIAKLSDDNSNEVYLEFFPEHKTFDVWADSEEDARDNIVRMSDGDALELLGMEEDDIWIPGWECSIKDAREFPGTVYHYTTEENWEAIQEHGGLNTSYGTGITNRNASGVFTSVDPEEHASGTYGDVCLAIDLTSFKQDSNLPSLNVDPEPEVIEVAIREVLLHKFEIESREEVSSDMSSFTMIVNHFIPLKYITEHGN